MHLARKALAVLLLGCASAVAAVEYNDKASEISCPNGPHGGLVIDGIAYRNAHTMPMIHFKGGNWAYLSWKYGVDSPWGRALLSLAQTAYATQARVVADCSPTNDVTGLWIQDF